MLKLYTTDGVEKSYFWLLVAEKDCLYFYNTTHFTNYVIKKFSAFTPSITIRYYNSLPKPPSVQS